MIEKQASAFGKRKNQISFFVQLNQNQFSIQRYGFPQNPCQLTTLAIFWTR